MTQKSGYLEFLSTERKFTKLEANVAVGAALGFE